MSLLTELIAKVKCEDHPFVVVTVDDSGIRWRAESQGACEVMAKIIGNCRVMPTQNFVDVLEQLEREETTA